MNAFLCKTNRISVLKTPQMRFGDYLANEKNDDKT